MKSYKFEVVFVKIFSCFKCMIGFLYRTGYVSVVVFEEFENGRQTRALVDFANDLLYMQISSLYMQRL